jgi:hypothetical protein
MERRVTVAFAQKRLCFEDFCACLMYAITRRRKTTTKHPLLYSKGPQRWETLTFNQASYYLASSAAITVIIVTQALENVTTNRLLTTYKPV